MTHLSVVRALVRAPLGPGLAQGLAADADHPAVHFAQVGEQFADGPAGEGLAELGRAGGGRLDDEVLVVRAEQAGTASCPPRVRADLVEPVDHVPVSLLILTSSATMPPNPSDVRLIQPVPAPPPPTQ